MIASSHAFVVSDDAQLMPRRTSLLRSPAVSETGIVFDAVEATVDFAELPADTLDKGAYIGAIPLRAVPRNKIFAVDEIVDLAVAEILVCSLGQQGQDAEFRQRQIDRPSSPQCPICVKTQRQGTQ